jgi:hypothetical protein
LFSQRSRAGACCVNALAPEWVPANARLGAFRAVASPLAAGTMRPLSTLSRRRCRQHSTETSTQSVRAFHSKTQSDGTRLSVPRRSLRRQPGERNSRTAPWAAAPNGPRDLMCRRRKHPSRFDRIMIPVVLLGAGLRELFAA